MLVYIPSEQNSALLDAYCEQNAIPYTKHETHKLSDFVATSISNLSHVTVLAIDLSALDDSDDDIIGALVTLKAMYSCLRIIIIALGRVGGDPLMGRIFAEGIYNLITNTRPEETKKEIIASLSDSGMQYSDVVSFRLQESSEEKSKRHLFSFPKRKEQPPKQKREPKKEVLKEPPRLNPVIQPSMPPIQEPPTPQVIERIVYKTEVRRLKQSVSIGICGAGRRTGATHQALMICRYLTTNGFRVAYLESNSHEAVKDISTYFQPNINRKTGLVQVAQINMFPNGYKLPVVLAEKYDFYVYDYGELSETPIKDFLRNDVKIVTSGVKPWEIRSYGPVFRALEGFPDINFILCFSPEDEQESVKTLTGIYGPSTFFSDYAPSPFTDEANHEIYGAIFKEYLRI